MQDFLFVFFQTRLYKTAIIPNSIHFAHRIRTQVTIYIKYGTYSRRVPWGVSVCEYANEVLICGNCAKYVPKTRQKYDKYGNYGITLLREMCRGCTDFEAKTIVGPVGLEPTTL